MNAPSIDSRGIRSSQIGCRALLVAAAMLIGLSVLVDATVAQEILYSSKSRSRRAAAQAQADLVRKLVDNRARNQRLKTAREKGFMDTLDQVEKSAIPMPDNKPIVYPSPERWRQISERRRSTERSGGRTSREAATNRIEQKLQSNTQFNFIELPLTDAMAYFEHRHRVQIRFDSVAFAEAGLGSDAPITMNLKGISLKSALRLILDEYELTYVIHNEVVLITTKVRARSYRTTKVYYVGDLIQRRTTFWYYGY